MSPSFTGSRRRWSTRTAPPRLSTSQAQKKACRSWTRKAPQTQPGFTPKSSATPRPATGRPTDTPRKLSTHLEEKAVEKARKVAKARKAVKARMAEKGSTAMAPHLLATAITAVCQATAKSTAQLPTTASPTKARAKVRAKARAKHWTTSPLNPRRARIIGASV